MMVTVTHRYRVKEPRDASTKLSRVFMWCVFYVIVLPMDIVVGRERVQVKSPRPSPHHSILYTVGALYFFKFTKLSLSTQFSAVTICACVCVCVSSCATFVFH